MKTLSLKGRLAIAMSSGVLALVVGLGAISMNFAERDLRRTLSGAQLDMVTRVADGLDEDLRGAVDALAASAVVTPVDVAADADRFATAYAQQPALLQLFEEVFVVDTNGVVTGAYPQKRIHLVGVELGDRAYFKSVMATGKPVVSEALRAKLVGTPIIDVAAPIRDGDGRIRAVLVGVLPLTKPNFLGAFSTTRNGRTGYFAVTTTGPDAIYLAHPDPARLMKPVLGGRGLADARTIAAHQPGSTVTTVDGGREALVSFKPLATVGWVVAAVLPEDEAFETITRARERTIATAVVAALIVLPLVWLIAWFLLRPLTALRDEVEAIATNPKSDAFATVRLRDEVGEVAAAFNAMLAGQRTAEAARVASDQDRRRLVAILESSRDFVAMTNVDGRVTYLNASARAVLGLPLDADVSATTIDDHFAPWAAAKLQNEGIPAALAHGIWLGETAVVDRNGREVPVDQTVIAHRNLDGRLEFFSSLMHDTTASQAAATAMRSSEARMLSIADALPVHVSFLDREYRYRFVNSIYESHFGIDRSRIVGRTVCELIGPEAYRSYEPFLRRAATGQTQVFEVDSRSGVRPVHLLVKIIPEIDDHGRVDGYHFIHQDVTDHKVENQRLSRLIRADALTGLLNRAGFESAITDAMERSRHHLASMALFYLDVDRFKAVNDAHGHQIGDKLLRGFASRLVRAVRGADVVAAARRRRVRRHRRRRAQQRRRACDRREDRPRDAARVRVRRDDAVDHDEHRRRGLRRRAGQRREPDRTRRRRALPREERRSQLLRGRRGAADVRRDEPDRGQHDDPVTRRGASSSHRRASSSLSSPSLSSSSLVVVPFVVVRGVAGWPAGAATGIMRSRALAR